MDSVVSGRLAPSAIGWSRTPVHRIDLTDVKTRRKRWEYWAVQGRDVVLMLTVVDVDLFSLVTVGVLDLATGRFEEHVRPLPRGIPLPTKVHDGDVILPGVQILARGERTYLLLEVGSIRAEIDVERAGRETLNVMVPFPDGERFAFTSKQVGLPARGFVRGHRRWEIEGTACLDHGRGTWPWRTRWNWASASNGEVGFTLGARWTDGSGTNENGLFVGRRLHNLVEDVRFELDRSRPRAPFRIHSEKRGEVDLLFTPHAGTERLARKRLWFDLGVIAADLDLRFGEFTGRVGQTPIDRLFGWAEAFDARW